MWRGGVKEFCRVYILTKTWGGVNSARTRRYTETVYLPKIKWILPQITVNWKRTMDWSRTNSVCAPMTCQDSSQNTFELNFSISPQYEACFPADSKLRTHKYTREVQKMSGYNVIFFELNMPTWNAGLNLMAWYI